MFIENLDRHTWTLREAQQHVSDVILSQIELGKLQHAEILTSAHQWNRTEDPVRQSQDAARRELLIALKDGDLHATGRLSTQRRERFASGFSNWDFHSGRHEPISPAHWCEGRLGSLNKLEYREGEFIDIRMPRVMVKAIWPDMTSAAQAPYTTPYLDLMQAAIRSFQMTPQRQQKKETLVAWFLEQEIDGEPVSDNLASAMATLVRLPSSQRGGARRTA
jgi:hypothetical protein